MNKWRFQISPERCRMTAILFITLCVNAGIYMIFLQRHNIRLLKKASATMKESFRPVSIDGVFTFYNVCLERLPVPYMANVHQITFPVTQRIVIYDRSQSRFGSQQLYIAGPPGHPWNYFDIYFINETLPLNNHTLIDSIAYFVSSRCPGNLHHFFHEEYIPLYSVVRLSNRLHPNAKNMIMYNTPNTNHNHFCRNFTTYNEIMRTLYTNDFHDVYYNGPNNTCFRKAVFGSRIHLNDYRNVVDHIINLYNLSAECANATRYINIVYRKYRRILNIQDLYRWVLKNGFPRDLVRIIDFDHLSIRRQMELACTSQVMIGINGAALQWSMLMRQGSHVVEMSWPSKSWGFFFAPILPSYRIHYYQVELKDIRVNWTSYEIRIRNGGKVGEDERKNMLKSPPQDLWKWSDGFVHEEEVNRTLDKIFHSIYNVSDSMTTVHRSEITKSDASKLH